MPEQKCLKEALVVLAKAPREGAVKTRLLGALTISESVDAYTNFLRDTFVMAESIQEERENLQIVLCYTPVGDEEAFETIEREGSLMLPQRGEGFGERLFNCFSDLFAMVAGLEIILNANGKPVKYGTGVAAVQEIYERSAVGVRAAV